MAATNEVHTIQRWRMKNMTPFLYLPSTALNEALYAARTRPLMLFALFVPSDGRIMMAHKAGQSVNAEIMEMPTAVAIVMPNCV